MTWLLLAGHSEKGPKRANYNNNIHMDRYCILYETHYYYIHTLLLLLHITYGVVHIDRGRIYGSSVKLS